MSANRVPSRRELGRPMRGPVFMPGDAGYTAEVAGFNTAIVHTPEMVVGARDAGDGRQVVRWARALGAHVSVLATGHDHIPIDSGLLVSTRRLAHVAIDAERQIATIGGGARWGAVIAAAARYGLFPIAGASPDVGVTGYLLGGGLGPLARAYGYSSDHVVAFSVVTGCGELVEATVESHPDLFWALRGGKHGLGIVIETRLRLVALRSLYAGSLVFGEEQIEPALRHWIAWTATADPRVTTSVAITDVSALGAVSGSLRGQRLLTLRFAFPGGSDEGARLAAPLRAAAPVALDALTEMPVTQLDRIHDDPREPGPFWIGSLLLARADQELASTLLDLLGGSSELPFASIEIRQLGGATRQDVPGGSAVGGRAAAFVLGYAGRRPEHFASVLPAASARIHAVLDPWRLQENSINFLGPPRSAEHLASAWPLAIHARLTEVRRQYDPDGIFALPRAIVAR